MLNHATLIGHVGKKETKDLKNGGEVTVISLATSKKYKDSTGQAQEQTTWHNVFCFSKLSDIAKKYVHVGDVVAIVGEIQNKKIDSGERAGQHAYSIHANEIKFIPKGKPVQQTNNNQTKSLADAHMSEDEIPF